MNELRKGLPELPRRMVHLPIDDRGYPVPWFVTWFGGQPDFRVADGEKWKRALRDKLCWCCGEQLGAAFVFVAGPMCGINRTTSEPPVHADCAEFAARACPFMLLPRAKRRDIDIAGTVDAPGVLIARNPGVAMLWCTRDYRLFKVPNGYLIRMGEPERVTWYAQGRVATRDEVLHSIRTGLPRLEEMAAAEGPGAITMLESLALKFERYVPALAAA